MSLGQNTLFALDLVDGAAGLPQSVTEAVGRLREMCVNNTRLRNSVEQALTWIAEAAHGAGSPDGPLDHAIRALSAHWWCLLATHYYGGRRDGLFVIKTWASFVWEAKMTSSREPVDDLLQLRVEGAPTSQLNGVDEVDSPAAVRKLAEVLAWLERHEEMRKRNNFDITLFSGWVVVRAMIRFMANHRGLGVNIRYPAKDRAGSPPPSRIETDPFGKWLERWPTIGDALTETFSDRPGRAPSAT